METQSSLDMSLADLINHSNKPQPSRHAPTSGPLPHRRLPNRAAARVAPYSSGPPRGIGFGGWSNAQGVTKLYLSNLDYDISNEDIRTIFSEVGVLEHHSIHYDRSGRSKGSAEVVFARQGDALAAIRKYNNVLLDGKPMKIELVGNDFVSQLDLPPTGDGILGKPNAALLRNVLPRLKKLHDGIVEDVYGHGKAGLGVPMRGRSSVSGHGRARGAVLGKSNGAKKVTAQDLDAELERYHLEALQIE